MERSRRFPILCAVAAILLVGVIDWAVVPFNEMGRHQWATSWLAGMSRLLQLPGLVAAQKLGLQVSHRPSPAVWCFIMAANAPIYLVGAAWVRWTWTGGPSQPLGLAVRNSDRRDLMIDDSCVGPHFKTRRQFIAAANRAAMGGAAAALGYSFLVEPHRFIITRHTIPIRGLPPSLHGMTVAHLTDVHHGPWTPLSYVRRVVETTNALKPDLIALTGDNVVDSADYITPVVNEFARLRAKIGVVGVMGNHDWWEGGPQTQAAFSRVHIPLIDNRRLFISCDRKMCDKPELGGLCVAGLADLWQARPDYRPALQDVPPDMPRLLLSHNPDTAEMPAARDRRNRVDLMLCGHTHGGQVRLPGIGTPIIPSSYGQKYAHGLVRGPAFRVFISSGLGTTVMPIRFGQPPEIALLTLESATTA